jgi:hypothetical protein
MWKASRIGMGLIAALLLAGCKAKVYDISVKLDSSMKQDGHWRTLDVDLVGINESDRPEWESTSIDAYFSAGNTLRSGANADGLVRTLHFSNADPSPRTIARSDAMWQKWQQKPWLVVMAQLPPQAGAAGPGDRRRIFLPLDRARWPGQAINITVRLSGLKFEPDLLPPK